MTTTTTLEQTARQYLATKASIASAQEALEFLETSLKAEMLGRELNHIECDGRRITLVQADRRSFDASALKNLVKPSVFNKVTQAEVKSKLIDAALALGNIEQSVVDQITTTTHYTQIRTK